MNVDISRRLHAAATAKGLRVIVRGPQHNHIQIVGGPLLVNYYPDAAKRSAYIAGTTQRKNNVTPEEAVEMALVAPTLRTGQKKDHRPSSTKTRLNTVRRMRVRLGDNCHWCKERMIFRGEPSYDGGEMIATVEHVIPLGRGGLDNENNRVLAHKKCNNARGSDMPELEETDDVERESGGSDTADGGNVAVS